MAFALWRILRLQKSSRQRRFAITTFSLLLTLNAAWSWMFFWAHSPLLGLINIVPQFLVILATVVGFARLDGVAAICLVPLAAWVAFATILNTAIWLLNS
jgi:tryptophan-rich sensory protein